MLGNVFLKTLRDQRTSGLFWAAGLLAISAYVIFMYPVIARNTGLNEFIKDLPEQLTALVGGPLDYSTAIGFLSAQLYSVIAPLIMIVYAVIHGTSAIAGEEERGTLALMLANPVPRRRVVLQKAAALTLAVVLGAFVLWAGLLGWAQVADVDVDLGGLTNGSIMLGLVALFFGALGLAMGAATGRRGISGGLTGAYGVGAYLLNAFIPLVDWLRPARFITPFYYYQGNDPMLNGLSAAHALALIAGAGVLFGAAVFTFERRDLLK
jgi:ABC-2 type transport system permease protein